MRVISRRIGEKKEVSQGSEEEAGETSEAREVESSPSASNVRLQRL